MLDVNSRVKVICQDHPCPTSGQFGKITDVTVRKTYLVRIDGTCYEGEYEEEELAVVNSE